MPIFSVVDIDEKLFDAAYALVRTAMPDVTAAQWSDYARDARAKGGVLGLVAAKDTLFGFLSYRIEERLGRGRMLHVDHFMTFELSRSGPGRRTLWMAAEALARKRGCGSIEVRLGGDFAALGTQKARGWLDLGHTLDGVVFAKPLRADCGSTRAISESRAT